MVLRVQQVDGEYRVVVPAEALEALHLTNGSAVELRPAETPVTEPKHRYVTAEEALESYRRTEPLHRNTYRELAK